MIVWSGFHISCQGHERLVIVYLSGECKQPTDQEKNLAALNHKRRASIALPPFHIFGKKKAPIQGHKTAAETFQRLNKSEFPAKKMFEHLENSMWSNPFFCVLHSCSWQVVCFTLLGWLWERGKRCIDRSSGKKAFFRPFFQAAFFLALRGISTNIVPSCHGHLVIRLGSREPSWAQFPHRKQRRKIKPRSYFKKLPGANLKTPDAKKYSGC